MQQKNKIAVVLVGGQGKRLRSVLPDLPKPMAPINEKPFLAYLLSYLKSHGMTHVILLVCYMSEKIQGYFGSHYDGLNIEYVYEDQPLGTGGAILNAFASIENNNQPILVLNGDTFVQFDYQKMFAQHQNNHASLTVLLREISDCKRYGKVIFENNIIKQFREKGETGAGWINAGVYLMNPNLFQSFDELTACFSLEEFIMTHLNQIQPQVFFTSDYFIDIGIPEDYARVIQEYKSLAI